MTQSPIDKPLIHPTENPAAVVPAAMPALGTLMSRHVLRDGELILLVLKPSIWFILFNSLSYIAAGLILILGLKLFGGQRPVVRLLIEISVLLIAAHLMWSVLQWMGRLYVLTDMRILRLEGVFQTDIFDCPLRKVARTRMLRPLRERLLNLGSIEIIPREECYPIASWQTIPRPLQVHQQILAAIQKANQGSTGS
jgi:hypothetical protein